jgi:hypothetical protein
VRIAGHPNNANATAKPKASALNRREHNVSRQKARRRHRNVGRWRPDMRPGNKGSNADHNGHDEHPPQSLHGLHPLNQNHFNLCGLFSAQSLSRSAEVSYK